MECNSCGSENVTEHDWEDEIGGGYTDYICKDCGNVDRQYLTECEY